MLNLPVVLCLALLGGVPERPEPPLAIVGGKVILAAGQEAVEGVVIVVRDGLIEEIGTDVVAPLDARIVDATGYTVTPSFVDAVHELTLDFGKHELNPGRDIDDGRDVFAGTMPANRRGLSPEREVWQALAKDSADASKHRKAGFGSLLAAPSDMALGGAGAWMLANGRPPREALLETSVAQFGSIEWRPRGDSYGGTDYPGTLMGLMAHLRQALLDADHHATQRQRFKEGRSTFRPPVDPTLEALSLLLSGQMPLVLRADVEEDIRLVLGLGEMFPGLRLILAGGQEAYEVSDLLLAAQIPVILDLDFGKEPEEPPTEKDADIESSDVESSDADEDQEQGESAPEKPGPWDPGMPARLVADRHARWTERVSCAAQLREAGVRLAFGTFGRTPKELRESVALAIEKGGLDATEAYGVLTSGASAVFGGAAPSGRLELGALGTVTGWNGQPTAKASKVAFSIVGGRLFDHRDDVEVEKPAEDSETVDGDASKDKDAEPKEKKQGSKAKKSASKEDRERASTPYQLALAAALGVADEAVDWPVELDSDRKPGLTTGGNVLVRNATILTADDGLGTLHNADMLVLDGKVTALGSDVGDREGVLVIDGSGLFVAPGIVDCHAHVAIRGGINEWTRAITPEVTIEDEVDPDDIGIYRALAGGTTAARLLHGSANSIGGRHEVVKFRWGATAPEMVLEGAPRGVKFALGENPRQANWGDGDRFPKTRMGVEVSLRRAFEAALEYGAEWAAYETALEAGVDADAPRRDLRLEALVGILDGEIDVHSHSYRADEILMLIRIAEEYGFTVATFQHVLEGYKVAAEIAAHSGLGGSTFVDWWGYKFEVRDATPYNAALVHEAGAIMSVNSDSEDHIRRLNLEAAKTMKYGAVPELEALKMVTLNPAIQLGVGEQIGSLLPGKAADFAIYSGHPFDTTSKVLMTFVDGELLFERREGVYDAWVAEMDKRIEAGRAVMGSAEPHEILVEGRGAPIDPVVVEELSLPRHGTRAPSTPERPAPQPVALVGGRVHTMERQDGVPVVHDPGVVTMRGGRVESVQAGTADLDQLLAANYDVRDVSGLDVWPGLIDAGTALGIGEIGAVKQSMDAVEVGGNQVDVRVSTAWHPSSDQIPVARVNGVTSVLVVPGGRGIAGQSAVLALEGWTVADALVADRVALHISAPRTKREPAERDPPPPEECMSGRSDAFMDLTAGKKDAEREPLDDRLNKSWGDLREIFEEAREYARVAGSTESGIQRPDYEPRLEALAPFALGLAPVVFSANRPDQIADVLDFADEFALDVIIAGGRGAWKVADRLAIADVPVIVGPVLSLPLLRSDPYDAAYCNASLLQRAGVRIAFRTDSAWDARNLPYQAAMAVAFGLSEDDALHALTAGAADVLGLEGEIGRIRPGLRADVLVTQGSPLQITTRLRQVFVGGRDVGLKSRHTELYETYRDRLHDAGQVSR